MVDCHSEFKVVDCHSRFEGGSRDDISAQAKISRYQNTVIRFKKPPSVPFSCNMSFFSPALFLFGLKLSKKSRCVGACQTARLVCLLDHSPDHLTCARSAPRFEALRHNRPGYFVLPRPPHNPLFHVVSVTHCCQSSSRQTHLNSSCRSAEHSTVGLTLSRRAAPLDSTVPEFFNRAFKNCAPRHRGSPVKKLEHAVRFGVVTPGGLGRQAKTDAPPEGGHGRRAALVSQRALVIITLRKGKYVTNPQLTPPNKYPPPINNVFTTIPSENGQPFFASVCASPRGCPSSDLHIGRPSAFATPPPADALRSDRVKRQEHERRLLVWLRLLFVSPSNLPLLLPLVNNTNRKSAPF